jgi:hypothetical protein
VKLHKANANDECTDDQLRAILLDAPTDFNALEHARLLGRSQEAIEMLYGAVIYARAGLLEGDPANTHIKRLLRIASELGYLRYTRIFQVKKTA